MLNLELTKFRVKRLKLVFSIYIEVIHKIIVLYSEVPGTTLLLIKYFFVIYFEWFSKTFSGDECNLWM